MCTVIDVRDVTEVILPGLELDRMEKDLTSNSALRWTRLAGKPGFTAVRLARGAGAAAAERDQRVHIFEDYNEHGWIMTALPNMKHVISARH